ncbi:MAG: cyclase family protein [Clostridiales bacterium]|nr:cyclase family protein [Clostridiales bacterium]
MLLEFEKIIDISMPVSEDMPVYKGKSEKKPKLYTVSDFDKGYVYESCIEMNLHTGTHIDLPLHMIPGGDTVESLRLDKLICCCRVIDLTAVKDKITASDLEDKEIRENDFILLKTRNSYEDILEKEFIYIDKSAARFLAEKKIKGVGIDSLGIERAQPGHESHKLLMEAKVYILEGLILKDVMEGEYIMLALPINIVGAEAAPVRVVLLK